MTLTHLINNIKQHKLPLADNSIIFDALNNIRIILSKQTQLKAISETVSVSNNIFNMPEYCFCEDLVEVYVNGEQIDDLSNNFYSGYTKVGPNSFKLVNVSSETNNATIVYYPRPKPFDEDDLESEEDIILDELEPIYVSYTCFKICLINGYINLANNYNTLYVEALNQYANCLTTSALKNSPKYFTNIY